MAAVGEPAALGPAVAVAQPGAREHALEAFDQRRRQARARAHDAAQGAALADAGAGDRGLVQRGEHLGHQEAPGDGAAVEVVEDLLAAEVGAQDHLCADAQGDDRDRAERLVKERPRHQDDLLLGDAVAPAPGREAHEEAEVAHHRAFGKAGGARGVEDRAGSLRSRQPRQLGAGRVRQHSLVGVLVIGERTDDDRSLAAKRKLAVLAVGQGGERGIDDERARARVGDEVGELLAGQAVVRRHRDQAGELQADVDLEIFRAIAGEDDDPIAGGEAEPAQPVGATLGALPELCVAEGAGLVLDGDRRRLAAHDDGDEIGEAGDVVGGHSQLLSACLFSAKRRLMLGRWSGGCQRCLPRVVAGAARVSSARAAGGSSIRRAPR